MREDYLNMINAKDPVEAAYWRDEFRKATKSWIKGPTYEEAKAKAEAERKAREERRYQQSFGESCHTSCPSVFIERDAQTTLTYYCGKSPNGTSIYCSTGINTFVDLDLD